ncbi:MAG: hypothetical protein H6741_28000 [Alphaproteobacteria bacterium]|nr:hypothetical protein [Alphaproteobacteria bacterium]MCB9796559.1 hypothetical protein [Alphaproteobacteria bacterium]
MSEAERAKALLAEIAEERAKGGRIRLGTSAVVLLMFGTFGLSTYNQVKNFDEGVLLAHLQEQAATRVWPLVSRELDEIAADAVPALSDAMAAEAEAFLPKLGERLSTEAEVFQTHMNAQMKSALDNHLSAAMKRQDKALHEKLPDLASDQAAYDDMVRRLQASARLWAQEELDETFTEHILLLQSINESVAALRKQAEANREAGGGDLEMNDTLLLLAEILNHRANGEG